MNSIIDKIKQINQIINSNNIKIIHKTIEALFDYNDKGFPNETNGQVLYYAQQQIRKISKNLEQELLFKRFYKDSMTRYAQYIEPNMAKISAATFFMGTDGGNQYLGEKPQHKVSLSAFKIGITPVTQEIYHLYNPFYAIEERSNFPVVKVSWYDAIMFAAWVGCRLPTESEWEFSCGGNNWCCETEDDLGLYAWYSNNSDGHVHPVALLRPNQFGLYDMHGNVWEWCMDGYDSNYYGRSPKLNPLNDKEGLNKVCRGGSMHAFSEMCRSSFRHNEPPDFNAIDIGFRLAK